MEAGKFGLNNELRTAMVEMEVGEDDMDGGERRMWRSGE